MCVGGLNMNIVHSENKSNMVIPKTRRFHISASKNKVCNLLLKQSCRTVYFHPLPNVKPHCQLLFGDLPSPYSLSLYQLLPHLLLRFIDVILCTWKDFDVDSFCDDLLNNPLCTPPAEFEHESVDSTGFSISTTWWYHRYSTSMLLDGLPAVITSQPRPSLTLTVLSLDGNCLVDCWRSCLTFTQLLMLVVWCFSVSSTAFDLVDHQILIDCESTLEWLLSYVSGWTQFVCYIGAVSSVVCPSPAGISLRTGFT